MQTAFRRIETKLMSAGGLRRNDRRNHDRAGAVAQPAAAAQLLDSRPLYPSGSGYITAGRAQVDALTVAPAGVENSLALTRSAPKVVSHVTEQALLPSATTARG
jgi:hypothetical protein